MQRGDIWLVDLDPVVGAEAKYTRPAVVVSNDAANAAAARRAHGVITVVPVTSNLQRVHPFQALLPATATGLELDSKAQAEQVRSVDVRRLVRRIGGVPPPLLEQVDDALRVHLDL